MMCRILGSVVVAFPQSVFGREGTPEELSEAMACRILGFLMLPPHHLFPGERVRQKSYLKPWRVAFRALRWLSSDHLLPDESRGTI